ncbi:hypothetical protein [Klebsiella sp. BIGb0407]|uniref:hypothetical protein n=1 Tax=Klebsiella sp. BIGb0407 TaxID=2940603 RepID=UPI002168D9BD|nr:hypothetical protein [Klebsiella sp. BIGb0407]MCS3430635.1 hypothetical protein [Klebsiella sp. BIGb0407]
MNNVSLEDRIRAINWNSSYTAYGPANDVPELLIQLASDDQEVAKIASHKLWCGLCHQHVSMAPAGFIALPFILEILDSADDLLTVEILDILWGFAICCTETGPNVPDYFEPTRKRLISELPRFSLLSSHSDELMSHFASEIIKSLNQK